MASIPRPKTSVRPVSGSVGRQRISAPIEAFGGGSGLTELGRGVEALGAGAESVVREQLQKQQQEAAAIQKAEMQKLSKQRKLNSDRIVLDYRTATQQLVNDIKNTKQIDYGVQASKHVTYKTEVQRLREDMLKNSQFTEEEKEAVRIRMEKSDLERVQSLMNAQRAEEENYRKETRSAQKANASQSMSDGHDTLRSDNVNDWFMSNMSGSQDYYNGLLEDGLPSERAKQLTEEQMQIGADGAIQNKIGIIANSDMPDALGDEANKIIAKLPPNLFDKDTKADLQKQVAAAVKARNNQIKENADKADRDLLNDYSDSLANAAGDPDREMIRNQFIADNSRLAAKAKTRFNAIKIETPIDVEIVLDKALQESENPERYKQLLSEQLDSGKISTTTFESQMAKADVKLASLKKKVWNKGINKMEAIINEWYPKDSEQADIGKGQLKGTVGWFNSDVKLTKEVIDQWKNVKDAAFDDNVTHRELQEIQDAVFFKPDALMQMKKIENRLYDAQRMIERAALQSGTQDLSRSEVDPWTKARNMSNEDLDKALLDELQKGSKKNEAQPTQQEKEKLKGFKALQ